MEFKCLTCGYELSNSSLHTQKTGHKVFRRISPKRIIDLGVPVYDEVQLERDREFEDIYKDNLQAFLHAFTSVGDKK